METLNWDIAIKECGREIKEAQRRVRALKKAKEVFKARRDEGVPFPCEMSVKAENAGGCRDAED